MAYTYEYPRPALTVDSAVFAKIDNRYKVLLIERKHEPFAGKWALPGGFVDLNEQTEYAVLRELEEETGLKNIDFTQFYTFSDPKRDPRGHTVSVVYYGFTDETNMAVSGSDDAKEARWFFVDQLPQMAFDHDNILSLLIKQLKLI